MSEGQQPAENIHELSDLAWRIAKDNGLPAGREDVARALVMRQLGRTEEERGVLETSVAWTRDEFAGARVLAGLMDRVLGGEAVGAALANPNGAEAGIKPSAQGPQIPIEVGPSRTQVTRRAPRRTNGESATADQFDVRMFAGAFGLEPAHIIAWLSGSSPGTSEVVRTRIREFVGFEGKHDLGKLALNPDDGGVGLSRRQLKVFGIGLGYDVIEENGVLYRRDVPNPLPYNAYVREVVRNGGNGKAFRDSYMDILRKLQEFGKRERRIKNNPPE